MAASTSVAGLVTVVQSFTFGGTSNKKRKRYVLQIADATNGLAVGGETHKILTSDIAAAIGSTITVIEECSNLLVYTTSTGATVAVIPAAPSLDGSRISVAGNVSPVPGTAASSALSITSGAAGTAVTNLLNAGDVQIAATQTGLITIVGY